jgi:K+-sensing histidine kinase KdpD
VVQDTYASPYFLKTVDEKVGFRTRNMLDVPIRAAHRFIGVLCAVNKKTGMFVHEDVDLMSAIAGMVAMPVENARIAEALKQSLADVKRMAEARERAIHRISHEIKTPVSVLAGSMALLRRRLGSRASEEILRVLDRSDRNVDRLLEVQYAIEDILRDTRGNVE